MIDLFNRCPFHFMNSFLPLRYNQVQSELFLQANKHLGALFGVGRSLTDAPSAHDLPLHTKNSRDRWEMI